MLQILELMSRINISLVKELMPIIKEEGLSPSEILILWKVSKRETYKVTDLARNSGIPPSTFTGISDRLVSRNLLERITDPGDRRSVLVKATPQTKEIIKKLTSIGDKRLHEIFKPMDPAVIEQLITNLQSMDNYLHQKRGEKENGKE